MYNFEYTVDILQLFRNKESIQEIVKYIFVELLDLSTKIEEGGDKIPYPILFHDRKLSIQIDYQLLIHYIAKFAQSKANNDIEVYIKIMHNFALLPKNTKSIIHKNNRYILITYLEKNLMIINNSNYNIELQYFNCFVPKIIKHNDNYFTYRGVFFNKNMLSKYIKYDSIMDKYAKYIRQLNVEEIAFGTYQVNKTWAKINPMKPDYAYFTTDDIFSAMNNEQLYEHLISFHG